MLPGTLIRETDTPEEESRTVLDVYHRANAWAQSAKAARAHADALRTLRTAAQAHPEIATALAALDLEQLDSHGLDAIGLDLNLAETEREVELSAAHAEGYRRSAEADGNRRCVCGHTLNHHAHKLTDGGTLPCGINGDGEPCRCLDLDLSS